MKQNQKRKLEIQENAKEKNPLKNNKIKNFIDVFCRNMEVHFQQMLFFPLSTNFFLIYFK